MFNFHFSYQESILIYRTRHYIHLNFNLISYLYFLQPPNLRFHYIILIYFTILIFPILSLVVSYLHCYIYIYTHTFCYMVITMLISLLYCLNWNRTYNTSFHRMSYLPGLTDTHNSDPICQSK